MQVKKMPTTYDPVSEDVVELAKNLISKYHTHLINCNVAFLYKNKEVTDDNSKKEYVTVQKINFT